MSRAVQLERTTWVQSVEDAREDPCPILGANPNSESWNLGKEHGVKTMGIFLIVAELVASSAASQHERRDGKGCRWLSMGNAHE